jgi:Zinc finger, C3HC4 type (RING finger)
MSKWCDAFLEKLYVAQFWIFKTNFFTAPEKLPADDLCKICMDAPIEVVFLECGHTASCTACGKILNECPICRSYIVRIVRIFKS